ncbi:MAG: HAD family phosphatase [Oscillospiraceae bacterium]|jgi:HAD superfamily hydrolase (TIGR01509 family)|nr:HAD family phosphatase [Oscillospiraceae bacterium]
MLPALFPPHTAAIFDLDGTLLDSMWVWHAVDTTFFAARGLALPADYASNILSLTFHETAAYTIARFGLKESAEAVMEEWNRLSYREYRDHVRLKPGARAYLAALRAQGIRLGVASNLTRRVIDAVLHANGIDDWFGAVTSSDEVTRGKRYPDVFLRAAQKLGVRPADCVAFDDIAPAMVGIHAAGMTACAVREDGFGRQDWDEITALADAHILTFEDEDTL